MSGAPVDYYAILEIPHDAAEETIKGAIKDQRRLWTKRQTNQSLEKRRDAEDRLRHISTAEERLLDPAKRRAYDSELANYVPPAEKEPDRGQGDNTDWVARAAEYLRQGNAPSAHGAAREATDRQGATPQAWAIRGRASLLMSQPDSAVFEFGEAIRLRPMSDEYHSDLGYVYETKHDYNKALELYGTAAKIAPDNRAYPISIASVYLQSDSPDRAIQVLDPLQAADPDDEICNYYLAAALGESAFKTWTHHGDLAIITAPEQIEVTKQNVARALGLKFDDASLRADLAEKLNFAHAAEKQTFRFPHLGGGCLSVVVYFIAFWVVLALVAGKPLIGIPLLLLVGFGWYKRAFRPAWKRNARNFAEMLALEATSSGGSSL